MMLFELVVQVLLNAWPGKNPNSPKQRRRREAAFAAGEEVWFPGSVVGPEPYGGRRANLLGASPTTLATASALSRRRSRRILPTERLELVRVRPRSASGPERRMPRAWQVAEFRDGDTTVLIAATPWNLPYVTHTFTPR